jgi:phosphoribosylpyrophosphate synthetase
MLVANSVAAMPQRTPLLHQKLTTLSVTPLMGQALLRLHSGKPLAPLLSRWPVSFDD